MTSLGTFDRRFGVEIECGMPGGEEDAYYVLERAGFEEWLNVHNDGSGVEIASPILQGEEGFAELAKVYDLLISAGAFVTPSDGMHIHHDAPEFLENEDNVVRVVESWAANQEQIDKLVHHLRRNNWACQKNWTPANITRLKEKRIDQFGIGRGALNVSALQRYGTIEFRQHEGTLDYTTARAWIKFGQAFLDSVLRRDKPVTTCATPAQLLYRIRAEREAVAVLLAKDTESEVPSPNLDNRRDWEHDYGYGDDTVEYDAEYEESSVW